jgi:hypothetical protein
LQFLSGTRPRRAVYPALTMTIPRLLLKPIFYSAKKIVPLIQLIIAMPRGRGTTFRAD